MKAAAVVSLFRSLSLSLSLYVEQNRSMVTVNRSSAVEMLRVLLSRAADLCKEMQSAAAAADLLCWGAEELQLILATKKKNKNKKLSESPTSAGYSKQIKAKAENSRLTKSVVRSCLG